MSSGSSQIWRRRSGTAWIRAGLVIFILVFIWLQLNFLSFAGSSQQYSELNDSNAAILSMVPAVLHKFLSPRPKNFTITFANGTYTNFFYVNTPNISEMKRNIAQYNRQQIVHNENIFEPLQNDSIVIVVQIHDRITYLRHLIVSLAQAPGISQTLLVFSHDYYDEEMNSLVQSIDFCKVIQIFYPYSIQTHPNEFPGEDPGDCPRDMKKDQ